MSKDLQTGKSVEAGAITFGKLRERVKKGELDPKEVLAWLRTQDVLVSKSLITWLRNFEPKKVAKVTNDKQKGDNDERTEGKRSGKTTRRQRRSRSNRSTEQRRPGRAPRNDRGPRTRG